MKSKYLILFFSLIMALLSSFRGNAQPIEPKELLKKSDKALADIKTVVYKVDYKTKYLARKDTVRTTSVCSLYIAPKDKMNAYNIVDIEIFEGKSHNFGHRKYDGDKVLWVNYPMDSLNKGIKPEIYSNKRMRQSVVRNYSDVLLKEYFIQKKPFTRYQSATDKILVKEEVLKDTPVYVIAIAFKDQKDTTRDQVVKHYIRKSDFLPIAYYSFLRWENMEQYNYYEVDYLAINPDIPLEAFKVDENENINAKERYESFKKKIKN